MKKESSFWAGYVMAALGMLLLVILLTTPNKVAPVIQYPSETAILAGQAKQKVPSATEKSEKRNNTDMQLVKTESTASSVSETSTETSSSSSVSSDVSVSSDGEAANSSGGGDSFSFPMNINEAGKEALMEVKGIGEVKAEAILDYLADTGGITDLDDLLNVKGIGEKTLQSIKGYFYAE